MKKLQTLPVSSRQHNPPAPLKGRTASPAGKLCTGRDGLRALLTDTAGSRQPAYTPFSARIIPGTCSYPPYRSDIFKILFGIIIKIHEPAGRSIQAIACISIIKRCHCIFYSFLHTPVFLFIIKWPVFKNNILGFRNVIHKHLRRNRSFVFRRKPYSPAFRAQYSPVT